MNVKFISNPTGAGLEKIIKLWYETFGDEESFVSRFVSLGDYVGAVCAEADGELVGMAHLISLEGDKKAYYCYAVATKESHRGKGICGEVLEFIKNKCREDGAALLLHPASEGLAAYYRRHGFAPLSYSYTVECEGDGGAFYDISAAEYKRIRDFQLEGYGYYGWSEEMLEMSGLRFIAFDIDGEYMAAAIGKTKIYELCSSPLLSGQAARRAATACGKAEIVMTESNPACAEVAVMGYNCSEFSYFNLFLE